MHHSVIQPSLIVYLYLMFSLSGFHDVVGSIVTSQLQGAGLDP